MRIKLLILFILLFLPEFSSAKVEINSLLANLNNSTDNQRFNLLLDISVYYFIVDDSSNFHKFGHLALDFSKNQNDSKLEVDALNNLAFIYSYRNKNIQNKYAQDALNLAQDINYFDGIANAYFNIAYSTSRKEFAKKIEFYQKSLIIANKSNNSIISAISKTFLGQIYSNNDNYGEASKCLISAQKLFDKINLNNASLQLRYIYGELLGLQGLNYKKSKNLLEAEKYYKLYKNNSSEIGNFYGEAFAMNNLGNNYYNLKNYQEAIKCYFEAKKIWENYNITSFIGNIYNNLANIYYDMKEYDKVEINYNLALDYSKKHNDIELEARIYTNLADLRLKQKRYKEAIKLFNQSLKLNDAQSNNIMLNCYAGLAEVYDSLNNSNLALKYFKSYSELKDSITEYSKIDDLASITEKYKNEKILEEQKKIAAETEKKELEKQQRKYNLQYLAILIFVLFIFSVVFFIGKFNISITKIETMVFLALILLFEFIQVLSDPYINKVTGGEPIYNLMLNMLIALMLTPIDTYSEKVLRKKKK